MKKILLIYISVIASLMFVGCESEDTLIPSNKDEDRVANFVNSANNEYVTSIYNDYNCGLLYEFDPILDFAYIASDDVAAAKWEDVELKMIKESFVDENGEMTSENEVLYQAYIDQSLSYINDIIFKYIKNGSLMADYMPFKVLICEEVLVDNENGLGDDIITESDSRIGKDASGTVNCMYNRHSLAYNVNQDGLLYNAEKYRKDNFYIFLCRIMEMHDLYQYISEDFSSLSSEYYGESVEEVYAEDFDIDLEDDSEGAETVPVVVDKAWFYSKGFIDAKYFYNDGAGLTTIDGEEKAIKKSYYFVESLNYDVRSYLNEMLHRNAEELLAFPDEIKNKMNLLLDFMDEWGVDLVAFNPGLEVIIEN